MKQLDPTNYLSDDLVASFIESGFRFEIVEGTNILLLKKDKKWAAIISGYMPSIPYSIGLLISNKFFMKKVLQENNLPTPEAKIIPSGNEEELNLAFDALRAPAVLKQENSQKFIPSIMNISDKVRLKSAFRKLSAYGENILLERYTPGKTYHLFINQAGFFHVLEQQQLLSSSYVSINAIGHAPLQTSSKTQWKEVILDKKIALQMKKLAQKTLQVVKPLAYLGMTVVLTDENELFILELFHSVSPHMKFSATLQKKQEKISKLVVENVESWFDTYAAS